MTIKNHDFLNRLTQISSAPTAATALTFDYAYNTASQRVAITNTDNTRWDFQSDIQSFTWDMDLSGSVQGAGGVGGLLAVQAGPSDPGELANTLHFACNDGNGNIAALVNAATGEESAHYDYGPFGEVLRATGLMAEVNPIRFSTQYADDVSGDVKYLHRDYTSRMGRWLNRDPIGEWGGLNLYHFNYNDPLGHIDTDGQQSWPTGSFPIPCPPSGPGIPDPRPPGWPPNLPWPPPPKNPPSMVGEKTCSSQVADAIQLANKAMGKGKCKQWFIDHGANGEAYAVFCNGKCKLWCLLGQTTYTVPVLRGIGVCKDNIGSYGVSGLASLLIHEVGHHYVTIGPGREEGAGSAQDACADALSE